MEPIQLKRFNPEVTFKKRRSENSAPVIAILGKRGSGKSEIIRTIMYYSRDILTGIVISPTESGNSFYKQFIPDLFLSLIHI